MKFELMDKLPVVKYCPGCGDEYIQGIRFFTCTNKNCIVILFDRDNNIFLNTLQKPMSTNPIEPLTQFQKDWMEKNTK